MNPDNPELAPPTPPRPQANGVGSYPPQPEPDLAHWLWHDRLLRSIALCSVFLLGYQLMVTLLRPAWGGPATDWLLTVLAWPELAVVVYVTLRLNHASWPGALAQWLLGAALLCYATARTAWTIDEQLVLHHDLPFPSAPDLVFAFQYPLFFLAVIFMPHTRLAGPRLLTVLDSLLWMGTAVAFSWYFLLAPIFIQSGLSPLARAVGLAYPAGGLLVLVSLLMVLLQPRRYTMNRQVLGLLVVAVVCLILGDSMAVWLVLHPQQVFRRGALPDLFWMACYLLIPFAVLVQWRLVKGMPLLSTAPLVRLSYQWDDIVASLRFLSPLLAAVLVSAAIVFHVSREPAQNSWSGMFGPLVVSLTLLLLVIMRLEVTFLESRRLQREGEEARASERVQRELNRRKDEFLSIVSHELKTPLTSLQGSIALLTRRLGSWQLMTGGGEPVRRTVELARRALAIAEVSIRRLSRLVNDLLDDACIQQGRLALRLERCDLGAIVAAAVEEQCVLAPTRMLQLELPSPAVLVPVDADATRIGQAVSNYLTNALKYSPEERPVTVRLEVEVDGTQGTPGVGTGAVARVSVHDEGIGVPAGAHRLVWERFQRIDGSEVQSGSGVGLGIGLSITKELIERHHGQVGVESTPGQGATFWFTLPLAPHTPDANCNAHADGHMRSETNT